MKTFNFARAFPAALIVAAISGASTTAFADIKDYKFELVDQTVQAGPDKVITVRLMNTKTGKPVPDAVIFAANVLTCANIRSAAPELAAHAPSAVVPSLSPTPAPVPSDPLVCRHARTVPSAQRTKHLVALSRQARPFCQLLAQRWRTRRHHRSRAAAAGSSSPPRISSRKRW